MSYQIKFTATSEQDLRDIGFHLFDESKSPDIALAYVARLRSCVKHLAAFPDSGSNPHDRFLIRLGYKFIPEGDYLTFYKVAESAQTVYIMAVLNGKTDYVRTLKKRL
ncbi:MAG: type II toxin-antitoxin system RelE/ParE family toxin [Clostridiales bacterium]|jgi:plasmid stabilization system protein ParE|nr:type II toxin-antitoxin system RelE/ParE family toxin [Clostridiales bacterium]